MYGLDLFSGIGGISLALKPWCRTVAYCEIDPYCQSVLHTRMGNGLDSGLVFSDVRTLHGHDLPHPIDIITGGFPCQDISLAGRRAGLDGQCSSLYREVIRLVAECSPSLVFLENVAAIRGHAWRVVEDLARLGFDCRWTSLSAAEVGAPHRRDRWWLLAAHPDRINVRNESGRFCGTNGQSAPLASVNGAKESLGDTHSLRELQSQGRVTDQWGRIGDTGWWTFEPDVGRVADGVPKRVDRLRALGNAVVPAQARQAFATLAGLS